jgi:hypothetical protein
VRDLFHATGFVVVSAGRTPAQLLLSREFVALHMHLMRRFGCPFHQFGIGAVVRVVFIEYGPARHPGFAHQVFKCGANNGQRADHVLAHPAHNDAAVAVAAFVFIVV